MTEPHPGPIQPAKSQTERLPLLLNGLLLLVLFVFSAATYADLPDPIPVHFDGQGRPNGWLDKSWWSWLALPLFALGLTVIMFASARLVDWTRRHPRWLNMPHKQEFLALPAHRQAPIWRMMRQIVLWLNLPMVGLVLYAQMAIHHLATHQSATIAVWPLVLSIGVMIALAIVLTVRMMRAVKRAVNEP
jgi:uncharacterized membrane protein